MSQEQTAENPPWTIAAEMPPRAKPSSYPAQFAILMAGRVKRPLGDVFGLSRFGVNLTVLEPGSASSLHHNHSAQDEFIYVLQGKPTLYLGDEIFELAAGFCAGFKAGGRAHHLENRTNEQVIIIEVGDRTQGDTVNYPKDDLAAALIEGKWRFTRKDGSPIDPSS
jgi:uncharacterized cupin superfamily protein